MRKIGVSRGGGYLNPEPSHEDLMNIFKGSADRRQLQLSHRRLREGRESGLHCLWVYWFRVYGFRVYGLGFRV